MWAALCFKTREINKKKKPLKCGPEWEGDTL